MKSYKANLIDVHARKIYPAEVLVRSGIITSIREINERVENFILPGFIDAHVHIESSMVTPAAFSDQAIRHGTIAAVADPHEIANVLGIEGVKFMIRNARDADMKILFGAPSCVPATDFESAGAQISPKEIRQLLSMDEVGFLSEMMNYPGVIYGDPNVMEKIAIAKEFNVPIDGHAPGLVGKDLSKYVLSGISTDHECFSYEEAKEKIEKGMKLLIREGSGAKNFNELIPLLREYPEKVMFCTDDIHPDDLLEGHINKLVKRALDLKYDLFDTLSSASLIPEQHYRTGMGLVRNGDPADFIMIDSLEDFNILLTVIDGVEVMKNGFTEQVNLNNETPNHFKCDHIRDTDLRITLKGEKIRTIQAIDGELITRTVIVEPKVSGNYAIADADRDILKIAVINRYEKAEPATGFIRGFGLKKGAIGSSISHDSHNIVVVGTSDREIAETANWIIENQGGIALHDGNESIGLPLEIAGILYTGSVKEAAKEYAKLNRQAALLGSTLKAPFMTLAFMALLVIPELKMSDKGLFDGNKFEFISLFVDDQ